MEQCPAAQFDVVLQSFSLHHLTREGKAAFFSLVGSCLRPGGVWVLIDIYCLVGASCVHGWYPARGGAPRVAPGPPHRRTPVHRRPHPPATLALAPCHRPCRVCLLLQEEDADLEPYRSRVVARTQGSGLDPGEQRQITDHAVTFDMPEKVSVYRQLAEAVGFRAADVLELQGGMCCALAFSK